MTTQAPADPYAQLLKATVAAVFAERSVATPSEIISFRCVSGLLGVGLVLALVTIGVRQYRGLDRWIFRLSSGYVLPNSTLLWLVLDSIYLVLVQLFIWYPNDKREFVTKSHLHRISLTDSPQSLSLRSSTFRFISLRTASRGDTPSPLSPTPNRTLEFGNRPPSFSLRPLSTWSAAPFPSSSSSASLLSPSSPITPTTSDRDRSRNSLLFSRELRSTLLLDDQWM